MKESSNISKLWRNLWRTSEITKLGKLISEMRAVGHAQAIAMTTTMLLNSTKTWISLCCSKVERSSTEIQTSTRRLSITPKKKTTKRSCSFRKINLMDPILRRAFLRHPKTIMKMSFGKMKSRRMSINREKVISKKISQRGTFRLKLWWGRPFLQICLLSTKPRKFKKMQAQ